MTVLIVGAGIAGPTLAYWLARFGFMPTIVERSPRLRTGGYVIDFWGAGFEVAERMGIMPLLERDGYLINEIRLVNQHGSPIARVPTAAFTAAVGSGFTSIPRGDLAADIFQTVASRVEVIFGDTVTLLEERSGGVVVTFASHNRRKFDLVVGAGGLHSRVRELVFGPDDWFERYLGLKVAEFEVVGYPQRDELAYVMYSQPNRHVARFAMRNDRTLFLFVFSDSDASIPSGVLTQKAVLRAQFGAAGWECRRILEALDSTNALYFDRVSQIEMPVLDSPWARGRVALVGDAAFCVSLLGGQGASLAMAAAYVLAGELRRARGDYVTAFARYQHTFGDFVRTKQRMARRFASILTPRSCTALFVRDQACRLLAFKPFTHLLGSRALSDELILPTY
jgi:2-polyprenyl-6-methoxyphenol hydroxylase-like FAD-dependent oxidoreductase